MKRRAYVGVEVHPDGDGGIKYRFFTEHPTKADTRLLTGWRFLNHPTEEIRTLLSRNDISARIEIGRKLQKQDGVDDLTEFQENPDENTPRTLFVYRHGNLWASTDPLLIRENDLDGESPGDAWRRLIDSQENRANESPGVSCSPSPCASSRVIPVEVRREVWRRDQGRCVICGSQERLEFDHIIPVSMGGASTVRNVQLLCESCNRSKGATLG